MTNPTSHGHLPEALLLADQYAAAHAKWELEDLYGSSKSYTAEKLAERHAARANLERALRTAHVQNPAEIEHVAGDVSKNEAEVNTSTQQPAPATQQAREVVAYLDIGAGGYLDLGSELSDEALQQLPKGRHALVIAGTYGIGGYVVAPQPSPTAQAASSAVLKAIREANMQLVRTDDDAFMLVPYKVATAQAAESVLAISDLPPLPDPDLRDVGTKPQDVKDFLNGYATEYARLALAARAPAESVGRDAERYRWLWHEDNDEIVLCNGPVAKKYWYLPRNEKLGAAIDSAMAANGGKQVMKIPELFSLMRLLSAMESAMLASKSVSPDYPSDEVARLTEILEREILARSKEQTP